MDSSFFHSLIPGIGLLGLCLCLGAVSVHAQEDSGRNMGKKAGVQMEGVAPTDSLAPVHIAGKEEGTEPEPRPVFEPDPKRAGMYSALFPGLGQAYNRQYWKLPIVAAGLGAAIYFIDFNTRQYQHYRKAYISRIDQIPDNDLELVYDREGLRQIQEGYRKNRDMTILLTTVGYAVQIMDAVASAHLRNFDMSEDLSMRFSPVWTPEGPGLGLVFQWK